MYNSLPSQGLAVVGVIDPDVNAAGTVGTAWIDMAAHNGLVAIIMAGDLGTSGTIAAKFQQAMDSSGTGVKDVTGKAIATMTQAGTDNSNKQALLNLRAADIDVQGGFRYVRLSMTHAVASSDSAAIVLALDSRYMPSSDGNAASVAQTVYSTGAARLGETQPRRATIPQPGEARTMDEKTYAITFTTDKVVEDEHVGTDRETRYRKGETVMDLSATSAEHYVRRGYAVYAGGDAPKAVPDVTGAADEDDASIVDDGEDAAPLAGADATAGDDADADAAQQDDAAEGDEDRVEIPDNWKTLPAAERRALAAKIVGAEPPNATEANAIIEAEAAERQGSTAGSDTDGDATW